jgi:hypothetical protein
MAYWKDQPDLTARAFPGGGSNRKGEPVEFFNALNDPDAMNKRN